MQGGSLTANSMFRLRHGGSPATLCLSVSANVSATWASLLEVRGMSLKWCIMIDWRRDVVKVVLLLLCYVLPVASTDATTRER
jgi:hypothetical protein